MAKHWLPLRERNKNNKGSMLIMVIMIVAIVGIVITILYAISLMNYRMKYTDKVSKDTFYDAESALDEIKTGLQVDVSGALTQAYLLTMESYSQLTEDERNEVFNSEYVRNLREEIKEPGDSSKYSLDNLNSYLVKTQYDDSTETGAKLSSKNNALKVTTQGVILEDVEITYYGIDDYVSYIRTDIVLNFPGIDFSQTSAIPKITTYSIIANTQFEANGTKADIAGNVYLGKAGIDGGAVINNSAITLQPVLDSSNMASVITGGDITLSQNASLTAKDVEVWADNIEVTGSKLDVSGTSYLKDDLVVANNRGVNGAAVSSAVKISGDYYGYGNPATAAAASSVLPENVDLSPADYSSAILVNGANTKMDLSGLSSFMLAGCAYVETTAQTSGISSITNADVAMGESLSIKSSQTAYLVPTSCIAPDSVYGRVNPMTADNYNELVNEVGTAHLVDFNAVIPEYGSSLSSMGVNKVQPAYYRLSNNVSMVYLFMTFDTQTDANNFFERYYSIAKNQTSLAGKLDLYTSEIKVPDIYTMADNTQFYYNGNILVNDSSANSFYINKLQSVSASEQSYLSTVQTEYQDNFTALNRKLILDYTQLSAEEKSKDVFNNLVQGFTYADNKYNIPAGSKKVFVSSGVENYAALVVNGDYTISSNRINGIDQDGNTIGGAELNVVIASGDVIVKSDFEGLIFAQGNITIENQDDGSSSYQIKADSTKSAIALAAKNSDGVSASYYLKDAAEMITGVNSESGGGMIEISDLITYQNWQKN